MVRANRGGHRSEGGQPEPERSRFAFVSAEEPRTLLLDEPYEYDDPDFGYVEPRSLAPSDWGDSLTRTVRRNPTLSVLAAVTLGILLGRLLRTP